MRCYTENNDCPSYCSLSTQRPCRGNRRHGDSKDGACSRACRIGLTGCKGVLVVGPRSPPCDRALKQISELKFFLSNVLAHGHHYTSQTPLYLPGHPKPHGYSSTSHPPLHLPDTPIPPRSPLNLMATPAPHSHPCTSQAAIHKGSRTPTPPLTYSRTDFLGPW